MTTLRAYAVGSAFTTRDVDGTDDFAWRPTDIYWTDVEYRRPRPRPIRPARPRRTTRRTASAVTSRIDPSAVRTLDQQRAVARGL